MEIYHPLFDVFKNIQEQAKTKAVLGTVEAPAAKPAAIPPAIWITAGLGLLAFALLKPSREELSEENKEEILLLHERLIPSDDISEELGLDPKLVRKFIDEKREKTLVLHERKRGYQQPSFAIETNPEESLANSQQSVVKEENPHHGYIEYKRGNIEVLKNPIPNSKEWREAKIAPEFCWEGWGYSIRAIILNKDIYVWNSEYYATHGAVVKTFPELKDGTPLFLRFSREMKIVGHEFSEPFLEYKSMDFAEDYPKYLKTCEAAYEKHPYIKKYSIEGWLTGLAKNNPEESLVNSQQSIVEEENPYFKRRYNRISPAQWERAKILYLNYYSISEIAKECDISPSYIRWRWHSGIPKYVQLLGYIYTKNYNDNHETKVTLLQYPPEKMIPPIDYIPTENKEEQEAYAKKILGDASWGFHSWKEQMMPKYFKETSTEEINKRIAKEIRRLYDKGVSPEKISSKLRMKIEDVNMWLMPSKEIGRDRQILSSEESTGEVKDIEKNPTEVKHETLADSISHVGNGLLDAVEEEIQSKRKSKYRHASQEGHKRTRKARKDLKRGKDGRFKKRT